MDKIKHCGRNGSVFYTVVFFDEKGETALKLHFSSSFHNKFNKEEKPGFVIASRHIMDTLHQETIKC